MEQREIERVLGESAELVLATMFFSDVGEAGCDSAQAPMEAALAVRVPFAGYFQGEFGLAVEEATARVLAENFLGCDEEIGEAQVRQVTHELANMICGAALSHLSAGTRLAIGEPRVASLEEVRALGLAEWCRLVEGGTMVVSLHLEQEPWQTTDTSGY